MLATWQRRNQVEHDGRVLIWEKTTAAVHFHYCPASISAKTQSVIARLICATTRWACYAHRVGPRWCPPPALSVWPSPSSSPSVCCLTVVMTIVPILSLATHSTTRGKWMRCNVDGLRAHIGPSYYYIVLTKSKWRSVYWVWYSPVCQHTAHKKHRTCDVSCTTSYNRPRPCDDASSDCQRPLVFAN